MNRSRTIAIALFIALLAGALFAVGTAPRTARADASCAITTNDLDAIKAASEQGLLAELAARRALLSRTITCAKNDAQALQNELGRLSVPDDARSIKSQLSDKLGSAMTYYDLELAKVPGAGIAGTQAVAQEVLAWRASNYEPLALQVKNFELWTNSQPLFAAGESRLTGITNLVVFLTQTAGQNNSIQSDLASAQSLMQAAKNENQAAKNALAQFLPPNESHAIIQGSLQTLSDTYQKFFDIANAIQNTLPAAPGAGGSGGAGAGK